MKETAIFIIIAKLKIRILSNAKIKIGGKIENVKWLKFLLLLIVLLALIGGAVRFESGADDWALVVDKTSLRDSVQNGAVRIYEFVRDIVQSEKIDSTTIKESDFKS